MLRSCSSDRPSIGELSGAYKMRLGARVSCTPAVLGRSWEEEVKGRWAAVPGREGVCRSRLSALRRWSSKVLVLRGAVFARSGEENCCVSSKGLGLSTGLRAAEEVEGRRVTLGAGRVAADTALFSLPHFVETDSVIISSVSICV